MRSTARSAPCPTCPTPPPPTTPPPPPTQLLREKQGNLTMINRVMADKQAAAQQQQGRPQGVGGV